MKKLLVISCMMFGSVYATQASGNESIKSSASARANHLSDQMIRSLRLNNFQSEKIREINRQVAEKMIAIEQQHAGDQATIDKLCKEASAQRDSFLEDVLSTVQYNKYYNNRPEYSEMDQEFMAGLHGAGKGAAVAEASTAAQNNTVAVN